MDVEKNITFLEIEYIYRINQICDSAREKHEDWKSTIEDIYITITNLVNFVVEVQIKDWIDSVFQINNIKSSWVMNKLKNSEITNLDITNLQKLIKIAAMQKFVLSNSSRTSKNRGLIYNMYHERVHSLTYSGISRDTIRSSHAIIMEDIKRVTQNILENINSLSVLYNTPLDIWTKNSNEGMKKFNEFIKSKTNDFSLELYHSSDGKNKYDKLSKLPVRINQLFKVGMECYIDAYTWMDFRELIEKYGYSEDFYNDLRYKRLVERYSKRHLFTSSEDINKCLEVSKNVLNSIISSILDMTNED